jgi:hypothetical protein
VCLQPLLTLWYGAGFLELREVNWGMRVWLWNQNFSAPHTALWFVHAQIPRAARWSGLQDMKMCTQRINLVDLNSGLVSLVVMMCLQLCAFELLRIVWSLRRSEGHLLCFGLFHSWYASCMLRS